MNIKKAWLALWGKLEPETVEKIVEKEVPVFVGDSVTTIYKAESKTRQNLPWPIFFATPVPHFPPPWHKTYYRSCEEAFAAGGVDADVTSMKALVAGDKAYILSARAGVDLQPKPKVPKGKRKADGRS